MADSDPISEATPAKRRKIDGTHSQNTGRTWTSDNDSADELTVEDFDTVATLPLQTQKRKLGFSSNQFRDGLSSSSLIPSSPKYSGVTQPTQPLYTAGVTQPTQPLPKKTTPDVEVPRSSPAPSQSSSPQRPTASALFSRPGGLLARAMAPPGTAYRAPLGIPSRPNGASATNSIPVDDDSDSEKDPPIYHSSDDEGTQGLRSNIKPTNFKIGGRGLDSSPNRVKESPKPEQSATPFANLMSQFGHNSSSPVPKRPADDMASAYGSGSRRPRPEQPARQSGSNRSIPVPDAVQYKTIDDIPDFINQQKVRRMQMILPGYTLSRYMDALAKKKGNFQDAMTWLTDMDDDDNDSENKTADMESPMRNNVKGVAKPLSQSQKDSSQPVRQAAKQQVTAPTRTIAEKYRSAQAAPKQEIQPRTSSPDQLSQAQEPPKPRKNLIRGRRPAPSPEPDSSHAEKAASPIQKRSKQPITIEDDSDKDSDVGSSDEEEDAVDAEHEAEVLEYLNSCTVQDLADLSSQPEHVAKFIVENRPFTSLEAVRVLSNAPETKKGKKSERRAIGDRVVEVCSEMMTGYNAVDKLVKECERIAIPIKEALAKWGVRGAKSNGELEMMNLDEAHDSGIGTPTSSCPSDDVTPPKLSGKKTKSAFLAQPASMGTEVTLKEYQLVGLNWLNLLWSKKFSCILADDMGLGKTCQVISFLVHLQEQKVDGVHLVIVPGSTLENWLREFARFGPTIKVTPYYGDQKERPYLREQIEQEFDTIDVVVTTYDMATKPDDNKFLRRLGPSVCVYDEAHALRNSESDRYKQLMRIPADFRLLLTGTPLQNNLQELIAILGFMMPDLFKEKNQELEYIFRHKATTKDTDHAALLSRERINRARLMMGPFILRRKKAQVLDLPTKHSRVEYCDMTDRQYNLYQQQLTDAQKVLAENRAKKGGSKASSNVMMALRQAAIHPLLRRNIYTEAKLRKMQDILRKHEYVDVKPSLVWDYLTGEGHNGLKGGDFALHRMCSERSSYLGKYMLKHKEWMDSGKVKKFKELIEGYAKNGDRVLVFSQFTTAMDILEAVLETLSIKYMRLDGQTRMDTRQDMIDKYTNDESITVFMLSTKAGGAGINLACANRVIVFDSGFNPQEDVQAENRAHRVGQTREVEVVRLVTRGTIEEQIHALGESKLALDERVAGEGASAADEKQMEKAGEKYVTEALLESLNKKEDQGPVCNGPDLKDAFKHGLEKAGLNVAAVGW